MIDVKRKLGERAMKTCHDENKLFFSSSSSFLQTYSSSLSFIFCLPNSQFYHGLPSPLSYQGVLSFVVFYLSFFLFLSLWIQVRLWEKWRSLWWISITSSNTPWARLVTGSHFRSYTNSQKIPMLSSFTPAPLLLYGDSYRLEIKKGKLPIKK